jgi:hypothetical protein
MDDFSDHPADDELFDGVLSVLERQRTVHARIRIATDISKDFSGRGPLCLYVKDRRLAACESLKRLVLADPSTEAGRFEIVKEQSSVREYLQVREWAFMMIRDGESAEYEAQGDVVDGEEESEFQRNR